MAKPTRLAAGDEPLQIFQDDFFEQPPQSLSRAPMPSVGKQPSPRRALQNANPNASFHPYSHTANANPVSPLKAPANSLVPIKPATANSLNAVSIKPPSAHGQSTDSMPKKQPMMSRFKTVAQKPMPEAGGKENMHPTLYPAPPAFSLNVEQYYQKAPGKRALLEAAPIKDSRPAKKIKVEDAPLPPHDSFPVIVDDGQKPNHSYAQLIGMAILRSPHRRLTLSQIYKWISDNYKYYNAQEAGWQNSIRHNLSLNKAFIKQERPKDDPGKGNYWAIEPGMEQQFLKEKPSRKSTSGAENVPVMSSSRLEPAQLDSIVFSEGMPSLPPVMPAQSSSGHLSLPPQAPPQSAAEVSSDATIPLSDNAAQEDQSDKANLREIPLDVSTCSPMPAAMQSSPPIPRHIEQRSRTPPPMARITASSGTRTHKRKHASMDNAVDDSGYISSLDSSVMRANQGNRLLTSEADRPRIKRGRAEEEIARLRASSYDSPTKCRSLGFAPPSSSPLRQVNDANRHNPLTPAVKFKPPPKPPASVSPNTNLRLHRETVSHMLNSPLHRITELGENELPWSPAFNMEDTFNFDDYFNDPTAEFDIFNDAPLQSFFSSAENGSPIKRSAKNPAKRIRLDRTQSAAALGEITGSALNKAITAAPLLKAPGSAFSVNFESPSKAFEGLSSPSKALFGSPIAAKTHPNREDWDTIGDFCHANFLQQEDGVDEEGGLDILQGFEKIGAAKKAKSPSKGSKPVLGRSFSTNF